MNRFENIPNPQEFQDKNGEKEKGLKEKIFGEVVEIGEKGLDAARDYAREKLQKEEERVMSELEKTSRELDEQIGKFEKEGMVTGFKEFFSVAGKRLMGAIALKLLESDNNKVSGVSAVIIASYFGYRDYLNAEK
ncbi:MAG: hypothetical protein OEV93_02655 [Candidatus Moranbacteria bacterium]|nr:hypothetical protein [Candidatus Moranbacteria bacterium]